MVSYGVDLRVIAVLQTIAPLLFQLKALSAVNGKGPESPLRFVFPIKPHNIERGASMLEQRGGQLPANVHRGLSPSHGIFIFQ